MVQASMDLNHFRFVLGASSHRSAAVGAGVLLSLQVYSRAARLYVGPSPVFGIRESANQNDVWFNQSEAGKQA